MTKTILKRDGRRSMFSENKIYNAILRASKDLDGVNSENYTEEKIQELTDSVVANLNEKYESKSPTVDDIQDAVEKTLILQGYPDIAKAYILFRNKRDEIRENNGPLMKIIRGLTHDPTAENNLKRENGNIDGDTSMGTMLRYGSESSKHYSLNYIIPKEIAEAHRSGDIHIHK